MEQMSITLTGELAEIVSAGIASGRYRDAREMVMEALRRLERDMALAGGYLQALDAVAYPDLDAFEAEEIRKTLRLGLAKMEAGESAPYERRKGVARICADIKPKDRERIQLARQ